MKIDLGRGRTGIKVLLGSLAFAASAGVALAQSYQFSTCGATGLSGPSQGDCNSAYAATSLAGAVTVTGGIQAWTVPQTGRYVIEAYGAQGGTQVYSPGFPGGLGAYISGQFDLVAGQTVYVLVGQVGGDTKEDAGSSEDDIDNAGPGGGGGSFVYLNVNAAFPLVAAGGGAGGSRCTSVDASLRNANAGTSGNRSGSLANGGTGGNGGLSNAGGNSYWAGGGSGWLTDGTGGDNATNNDYTPDGSGAEGGRAPRNGGFGGVRWNDGFDEGGDGGFGGGGGGGSDNMGTGGGGGFSGGGGARYDPCGNEPGGGGGSYNGGINPLNVGGSNSGDGAVTISLAQAEAAAVPTASTWALMLMALLLAVTGFVAVRRS